MTSEERRRLMSRIRGKDTEPELKLRRAVWALGLRYRLHQRIGRARPDLVFMRSRVAVFVDGCFWHCCPTHGVVPKENRSFWQPKLERNVQRDTENTLALSSEGWSVLRFWEHEIDSSPEACAKRIAELVRNRMLGIEGTQQ